MTALLPRDLKHGERITVTITGTVEGDVKADDFENGDDYINLTADDCESDPVALYADAITTLEILPPNEPGVDSIVWANGVAWQRVGAGFWVNIVTGSERKWPQLIAHADLAILKDVTND